MESTSSPHASGSWGSINFNDSLPEELLEKELQALERFQKLLVAIHTQYTCVFEDVMAATNGEIVQHLRILPSVVKERTKELLVMDFRIQGYTIFSGFEHTRRLITNGIEIIRRGLEDFYIIGDTLLVEKAKGAPWTQTIDPRPFETFQKSKEAKRAELASIEKNIAAFEADVLFLKVELDMVVTGYWHSKADDNGELKEDYPVGHLCSQYHEAIADKHKFIIRVLRSQVDFAFSSLEKIVKPTMRFNFNPRIATLFQQHPTRIPHELQEQVHKLSDYLALSKPTLVIAELFGAIKFIQSEYEKAFQIMVGFYESGIAAGITDGQPIARVQKTVRASNTLKQLQTWGYMHFEFQLAYARTEIERYREEIKKREKNLNTKAQTEMEKEGEEAMEKLLLAMMEVERKKGDLMGISIG
ncbi:hypothetical protein N431DRAFT_514529 [Stipitochalara longipes BDJ]|nr:hypothetical protein N431DRAFT_514529 [Stipitochalara longipes BDJ]